MQIRDVMTPDPATLSPADTIQSAARLMRDQDTGAVPVVENGRVIGMVTDRDIVVRAVADGDQSSRPVSDILTNNLVSVTPDTSTGDAAELMSENQVRRLPVIENGMLVGIVSLGDIAVKEGKDKRSGDTLQSISEGVKERG
jgi:CBS domain-containing protein